MSYAVLERKSAPDDYPKVRVYEDYFDAARAAHKIFESYGFELTSFGTCAIDPNYHIKEERVNSCFDNLKVKFSLIDMKHYVVGFMHAQGDGPCVEVI